MYFQMIFGRFPYALTITTQESEEMIEELQGQITQAVTDDMVDNAVNEHRSKHGEKFPI